MSNLANLIKLTIRDCIVLGLFGGLVFIVLGHEVSGVSFACGALWTALNFCLLGWMIGAVLHAKGQPKLFIFVLACAKIPASYYLLYWLYQTEYLEPIGLTAGLSLLPVVLLFRGLVAAGQAGTTKLSEEGK